jgi:hypothetical protein
MTAPALIVLRPGDKVLVTLSDDPDPEHTHAVMRTLRKAFPGVDFTLMAGVSAIAVAAPE